MDIISNTIAICVAVKQKTIKVTLMSKAINVSQNASFQTVFVIITYNR